MSAFTKVGKASASAAASAIKSVAKELSTNALVQTLSGKKGRINYRGLSRTPSPLPSISLLNSRASTPYLKPVTPYSDSMRSNSIGSLNNLNLNEYNNTQNTVFKPVKKSNTNYLYGGKLKVTRKHSRKNLKKLRKTKRK